MSNAVGGKRPGSSRPRYGYPQAPLGSAAYGVARPLVLHCRSGQSALAVAEVIE